MTNIDFWNVWKSSAHFQRSPFHKLSLLERSRRRASGWNGGPARPCLAAVCWRTCIRGKRNIKKKIKRRGLGVTAVPLISHPGKQSDSRLAARLHKGLPWDNRVHVTAENVRFGVIQQGDLLPFSFLNAWFPLYLKYFNYILSNHWPEKLDRKRKRCTEEQSAALLFRANTSKHPEHL